MKLLSLYEAILDYGTMKVDKNGFVKNAYGTGNESILIEGKQLVLPYSDQLRNFNPNEKMIFHPMAENIFKGESQVVALMKQKIMTKVNISSCYLLQTLINILASPDLHSQMNPQQAELFNMGMDADTKTLTNFVKIMTHAVKNKPDKGFVSMYLNRGASFQGKRCTRVSVVSFPFYEQLVKEKEVPNGFPIDHLRIKDKETLVKLFEFVFPELEKQEAYNYGTNNSTIPYLDALMFGSSKITSRLNDLVEIYKDYIEDYEQCLFSSDWVDAMRDIDSLKSEILRIPVQHGSDGTLAPVSGSEVEQSNQAQPMPVLQMNQIPIQQPQQQIQKPQSTAPKGKVSFEDILRANGVNPVNNGYPQQQMQPQMYQQPMPMHPQMPMQPYPYPQQQMQPAQGNGWPSAPVTGQTMMHGYPYYGR